MKCKGIVVVKLRGGKEISNEAGNTLHSLIPNHTVQVSRSPSKAKDHHQGARTLRSTVKPRPECSRFTCKKKVLLGSALHLRIVTEVLHESSKAGLLSSNNAKKADGLEEIIYLFYLAEGIWGEQTTFTNVNLIAVNVSGSSLLCNCSQPISCQCCVTIFGFFLFFVGFCFVLLMLQLSPGAEAVRKKMPGSKAVLCEFLNYSATSLVSWLQQSGRSTDAAQQHRNAHTSSANWEWVKIPNKFVQLSNGRPGADHWPCL